MTALLTGSMVVTAARASADTSTSQSFTSPGTYNVTVPDFLSSMALTGLGGAGFSGDSSSGGASAGGSAGSGTSVSETVGGGYVAPGDTLEIVVGAKGGGGQRGYGSELSGAGGNGGGASYVYDQTSQTYLLVAGGGGGGGGGSGLFAVYNGGRGGTDSPGGTGLGAFGQSVGGSGGDEIIGGDCGNGAVISAGEPGGTAPTASGQAGGGGGGGGACGGDGGQAGNGNGLVGGGGGGGSGGSLTASNGASNTSISNGSNTGDGSVSITFTTLTLHKPVITSANCMYSANGTNGHNGLVTAKGLPAPVLKLVGQPSWLDLGSQTTTPTSDNEIETIAPLDTTGQAVNGEYTFAIEATNSQGTDTEPLTVVEEPGVTEPSFVSAATATATAGSSFSYQVTAVSCPPVESYSLTSAPGWLSISENGVLSGTPAEADAGSHTFTITANPQGNATPFTQTFTIQVKAVVPGAPAIGTATAGNAQATVSFTPPADDGGAPVTGYTVTATDVTTPANGGQTATGAGSPITVTGLTNGDSYTFTVTATNSAGTSQPSAASNAVTPVPPGRPAADLSVTISPQRVMAKSTFSETVTVTNHGPWPATNVVTTVSVPFLTTVTADPGGTKRRGAVKWTATRIGVHGSVAYTITFKVGRLALLAGPPELPIRARSMSQHVPDPHFFNNSAVAIVTLRCHRFRGCPTLLRPGL